MSLTRRDNRISQERKKWDKLFNSLLKLVKDLQFQNEALLQQRNCLEEVVKTHHERWVFDVRLLEDQISEMKSTLVGKDMELVLAGRKCDLLTGLKQREHSLWKLKSGLYIGLGTGSVEDGYKKGNNNGVGRDWKLLRSYHCSMSMMFISESAEDELADFKQLIVYLLNTKSPTRHLVEAGSSWNGIKSANSKILRAEVKRLKLENQQLSSEMSILLKEKSFVWNQYCLLESNLSNKLRSKQVEVEQANDKVAQLLSRIELLQSFNTDKDEHIASLKANITELEASTIKWKDEVSNLKNELELLRKSAGAQVTPGLHHCNTRAKTSNPRNSKSQLSESNVHVKKDPSSFQATIWSKDTYKGTRSSKNKRNNVIVDPDTPVLFGSAFKVPKLKTPAPG